MGLIAYSSRQKESDIDFKLKYWPHYNFKRGHQGQFWKIQDVRSSELSLVAEFDAFLAEIFVVEVANPTMEIGHK